MTNKLIAKYMKTNKTLTVFVLKQMVLKLHPYADCFHFLSCANCAKIADNGTNDIE